MYVIARYSTCTASLQHYWNIRNIVHTKHHYNITTISAIQYTHSITAALQQHPQHCTHKTSLQYHCNICNTVHAQHHCSCNTEHIQQHSVELRLEVQSTTVQYTQTCVRRMGAAALHSKFPMVRPKGRLWIFPTWGSHHRAPSFNVNAVVAWHAKSYATALHEHMMGTFDMANEYAQVQATRTDTRRLPSHVHYGYSTESCRRLGWSQEHDAREHECRPTHRDVPRIVEHELNVQVFRGSRNFLKIIACPPQENEILSFQWIDVRTKHEE